MLSESSLSSDDESSLLSLLFDDFVEESEPVLVELLLSSSPLDVLGIGSGSRSIMMRRACVTKWLKGSDRSSLRRLGKCRQCSPRMLRTVRKRSIQGLQSACASYSPSYCPVAMLLVAFEQQEKYGMGLRMRNNDRTSAMMLPRH